MRPALHPRLVNDPFGDPGVYVPFQFENRAMLFDLGDVSALTPRELLKVTHAFVSHTHMDHFTGFDRLLRLFLGRRKTLRLFGPQGFIGNVAGKLAGYAWNLVDGYSHPFILEAIEVTEGRRLSQTYRCRDRFQPAGPVVETAFDGTLVAEPALTVSAAVLDHGIPSLAFSLEERFHINIRKAALDALGLQPGDWLQAFKQALYRNRDPETPFTLPAGPAAAARTVRLGDLAAQIARITPGQKISYVGDCAYLTDNNDKIAVLADGADQLFIEAAFLEADRHIARRKHHLTAFQAGRLARRAGVKALTVFHFSPRYSDQGERLRSEAQNAFAGTGAPLKDQA